MKNIINENSYIIKNAFINGIYGILIKNIISHFIKTIALKLLPVIYKK